MSAVAPPPPPPPTVSVAGQAALPALILKEIPPALLQQLAGGSRLEALVATELAGGAVRLLLPGTTVEAQTPLRLPEGATLTLMVPSTGPLNRLLVLAINGRALPGATPAQMAGSTLQPALAGAVVPRGGSVLHNQPAMTGAAPPQDAMPTMPAAAIPGRIAEGAVVTLTLLRPPAAAAPHGNAPAAVVPQQPTALVPSLPAGTTVAARVMAVQLPGQIASGPAILGTTPAPAQTATSPAPPPSAAPTETTAGPAPTTAGATLRAEVAATATGGHPVLHTRAGPMVLEPAAVLPKGSILTLALLAEPVLPSPSPLSSPFAGRAATAAAQTWPALNEVLATLDGAAPALSRAVAHVVPRPDGGLMAGALHFLSAVRVGALSAWIGEAPARALARLRPDLAQRIDDDAVQLRRTGQDAGPDGWRVLAFPLLSDQKVELVHLYLRRHGTEEDTPESEPGDRFVLDVRLSALGRVQLDGLYRPKRKRLDLIVRTERPFAPEARDEIRRILRSAGETTGLEGAVTFQANPRTFVEAAPEAAPGPAHGIVV